MTNTIGRWTKTIGLCAVVAISATVHAKPAGWEIGFLETHGGRPANKAEMVAKLAKFSREENVRTASYLVKNLSTTKAGRAFLFEMSDDIDRWCKAKVGEGFAGETKDAIVAVDADFATDAETAMAAEVTDATTEIAE